MVRVVSDKVGLDSLGFWYRLNQVDPSCKILILMKVQIIVFTGDHFCRCPDLHRCIQHHISGILSQQSKWHLSHGNYGNFEGV